jgi:hypothetical protein
MALSVDGELTFTVGVTSPVLFLVARALLQVPTY